MAAIEGEKLIRVATVEEVCKAPLQILCSPGGTQPFALEAKERDFVERIHHAQSRIEFQTINDPDRITKKNMLRPQISMTVDDVPALYTFG